MAKKQQVILSKTVTGLGKEGQLVKVSYGFWRNYLQPQHVAEIATPEVRIEPTTLHRRYVSCEHNYSMHSSPHHFFLSVGHRQDRGRA